MFLLPPVGGGETFELRKVYLIGTKNKFQFVFLTYMSMVVPIDIVQIEYRRARSNAELSVTPR